MKNNKSKKRIKKYANGTGAIANWKDLSATDRTGAISLGVSALANMTSNATNGQDVTVGSVISGTASGAASGAAIGGVPGAIVGGALGLGTSLAGRKSDVDEQTGEIDYGSGIGSWFGHSKSYLRNKSGRIKNGILSRENSTNIAADYYDLYGENVLTMANGGVVPNTMAYLDDGELIRTPDGQINEIPEEGKPTDSNLVNVPVGTLVLSDKMKVPGTNKTFAQMGKKIMSNKAKGDNIYSENSKMLNDKNNQIAYQRLLEQLEGLKNNNKKKGITKAAKGSAGINLDLTTPTSKTQLQNFDVIENRKKFNLLSNSMSNLTGDVLLLASPLNNIFNRANSEKVNTYTYTPRFISGNYNIDPQLAEINKTNAIARYNQANINPNTGAGMAYGLQSAVARNNALGNVYSSQYDMRNRVAAQNAGIYNQWAPQYANALHVAATEQAQNDAAARAYNQTAIRDLSTTLQSMRKDKRLSKRDQALLQYMKPFLEYGSTMEQVGNLDSGMQ